MTIIDIIEPCPDSRPGSIHVLVLDDEPPILRIWSRILNHPRYRVSLFTSPGEALQLLRSEEVDVAIVDLCMPEMDGMRFLAEARHFDRDVQVIIITAQADVRSAVEAIRQGAYDFLPKPLDNPAALEVTVLRAAERRRLARRVRELETEQHGSIIRGFVGEGPAIRKVIELVQAVAVSDATVLICGESGTGKELIARAIHENSPRRSRPLMAINCSAFADSLLEDELFGHAKGAYTGADSRRAGIFEAGEGGTVFLDEIADMSPACQAKVLRTLQEGEIRAVGSTSILKVNVRIVAATNADLEERCREGRFRKDLFYRLNVVKIDVPALRGRREDIPLLVAHFLHRCQKMNGKRIDGIRASTIERIARHPWPGNVRELKNAVERAVLLAPANRELGDSDFPTLHVGDGDSTEGLASGPAIGHPRSDQPVASQPIDVPFHQAKAQLIEQFERGYLAALLDRHGSITAAADAAGLDRSNLKRMLRRNDLLSSRRSP